MARNLLLACDFALQPTHGWLVGWLVCCWLAWWLLFGTSNNLQFICIRISKRAMHDEQKMKSMDRQKTRRIQYSGLSVLHPQQNISEDCCFPYKETCIPQTKACRGRKESCWYGTSVCTYNPHGSWSWSNISNERSFNISSVRYSSG